MEDYFAASGLQPLHHHRRAGQGGMAAQWYLDFGREPPQAIIVTAGNQKSGFGQVVFGSNGLQRLVSRKVVHQHYRCRVPREAACSESINLEDPYVHGGYPARTLRIWV